MSISTAAMSTMNAAAMIMGSMNVAVTITGITNAAVMKSRRMPVPAATAMSIPAAHAARSTTTTAVHAAAAMTMAMMRRLAKSCPGWRWRLPCLPQACCCLYRFGCKQHCCWPAILYPAMRCFAMRGAR